MHSLDETIAALATPPGEGALAIIRISGPRSRESLLSLLAEIPDPLRERYLHRVNLVDEHRRPLDEATALWMPGPGTFTGEDSAELIVHGGPLTVRRILAALFACGVKQAEPGEFSYRATINGRMDLMQAEAVAELIHSRSEAEQHLALSQLGGSLSRRLSLLRDKLVALLRDLEAGLDFSEEDIDFVSREHLDEGVSRLREAASELLAGAEQGKLIREGLRVVIAGEPNVGKSSLFNALLEEERAIVTEAPGTTRDTLRETLNIGGLLFHLHDTAGLREGLEEAERLGVARSETLLEEAQLTLWLFDGTRSPSKDELQRLGGLSESNALLVFSKCDDPEFRAPPLSTSLRSIILSAKSGEGLSALRDALFEMATGEKGSEALEVEAALNRRQESRLRALFEILEELDSSTLEELEADLLASRLRAALNELDELSGDRVGETVLSEIFSNFCVGK
ncbi:tRNA uridine-5-carboxymethylaminomethyl(34) synthesis GTPase MnmE [bacterium]|nr:tRNA uridine-5-carboxymethylaminomethyl(34) synthesis GTPase MnmE [bacterium]